MTLTQSGVTEGKIDDLSATGYRFMRPMAPQVPHRHLATRSHHCETNEPRRSEEFPLPYPRANTLLVEQFLRVSKGKRLFREFRTFFE